MQNWPQKTQSGFCYKLSHFKVQELRKKLDRDSTVKILPVNEFESFLVLGELPDKNSAVGSHAHQLKYTAQHLD